MAQRHDTTTDIALVELARTDHATGWAAIWDAHGHALHGYCRHLLDDAADADDVVADVFLVASRRLDQLRDPAALRAWLFAIGRRSVQRRWRARQRTVPVDPQGAVVTDQRATGSATDELTAVSASDAAALVEAASAGLSISDRELLALTLGADLDTSEVARITGDDQGAVSVRVTRLKDRVAKAAGALLVARHHRRDCEVLDGVLASWDGTFDPVWRKRIARHVERCDTCDERRRVAVAVFASPLFLAPPSSALRSRVLEPISSVTAGDAVEGSEDHRDHRESGWEPGGDGFPAPQPWPSTSRRRAVGLLSMAALLFAVVGGLVLWGGDDAVDVASSGAETSTTTTGAPTTSTSTSTTSTTTLPVADPVGPPADEVPDPGPAVVDPPPTAEPPALQPSVDPAVSLRVAPRSFAGCGASSYESTATIVVTPGGGDESTTISWEGGSPGATVVGGAGTFDIVIGPLERVDGGPVSQTIAVSATTVDAAGATATDTDAVTIAVVPC